MSVSNNNSVYYFAYGANMHEETLRERIKDARTIGPACLKGYALRFNKRSKDGSGKANIEKVWASHVHGILYTISQQQLTQLDKYEAAPLHYQRQLIIVDYQGQSIEAQAYIATDAYSKEGPQAPSEDYLDRIVNGAAEHNLPIEYIAEITKVAEDSALVAKICQDPQKIGSVLGRMYLISLITFAKLLKA